MFRSLRSLRWCRPATQSFGLGIFEELTAASLDVIERFFLDRGAQVDHEVSPLVGVGALNLLCSRRIKWRLSS